MAADSEAPGGAAQSWTGRKVTSSDGSKLGKLEHVYLAHGTDRPTWGVVKTGPLGRKRRFVPLERASEADGNVAVPVPGSRPSSVG